MSRLCDTSSVCSCTFVTNSGQVLSGEGTPENPYIVPICDDPVFTIKDCADNELAVNCGDTLLVYPSGFNGGPVVNVPTIENGILYMPRFAVEARDSQEDIILGTLPAVGSFLTQDLFQFGQEPVIDTKVQSEALVTVSATLCQQVPAPPPEDGECVDFFLGIRSTGNVLGSGIDQRLISSWSPPIDTDSAGCVTITDFIPITLFPGPAQIIPTIQVRTSDCPFSPDRVYYVDHVSVTVEY